MGATRELRQSHSRAAIVSIDNLSKFILEVKRENDDEFWQAAPRPYGLSGSIAALLDVVRDVNWAEPPEPDAGDPDSEAEGPPTPKQPKGFADRAPAWASGPQGVPGPERRTWLCNPRVRLHISPGRPRPGPYPGPSRRSQSGPSLRRPSICRLSLSAPTLRLLRVHPLSQALLRPPPPAPLGWEWFDGWRTASGSRNGNPNTPPSTTLSRVRPRIRRRRRRKSTSRNGLAPDLLAVSSSSNSRGALLLPQRRCPRCCPALMQILGPEASSCVLNPPGRPTRAFPRHVRRR